MIEYKGRIPTDIEAKIRQSICPDNMIFLLTPLSKRSTASRTSVVCPKCKATSDCYVFHRKPDMKCFKCGMHMTALELVMDKCNLDLHDALLYIAEENGIKVDGKESEEEKEALRKEAERINKAKKEEFAPTATAPEIAPVYLDYEVIAPYLDKYDRTPLFHYFTQVLGIKEEVVRRVMEEYAVGGIEVPTWARYNPGHHALFLIADACGNISQAKVMGYRPDGHRIKFDNGNGLMQNLNAVGVTDWKNPDTCHPFFGSHLINLDGEQEKPIVVVESEKTGMLMRMIEPRIIWTAANSLHWIRPNNIGRKLKGMENRAIYLLPDRNGIDCTDKNGKRKEDWEDVAQAARAQGYNCQCLSNLIKYHFQLDTGKTEEDKVRISKADIGDAVEDTLLNPLLGGEAMRKSLMICLIKDIWTAIANPGYDFMHQQNNSSFLAPNQ